MTRFYCTTCRKMKRVRHLPAEIRNADAANPRQRLGKCDWHHVTPKAPAKRAAR
jgi:hypothetical protein